MGKTRRKSTSNPWVLAPLFLGLVFLLLFLSYSWYLHRTETRTKATPSPLNPKVIVLIFNPKMESQGGKTLIDFKQWHRPESLQPNFIQDIKQASGGFVNYQIVSTIEIDDIPTKADSFDYTTDNYLSCLNNSSLCHQPDTVDYSKILRDFGVCDKRNRGEIDELWLWGGPYFGYWESALTGPGAFWYNSPPITNTSCTKLLPIMGFNYERGVAEMLEDVGHRFEATMDRVFGSRTGNHLWADFVKIDRRYPGQAGCGDAHNGPNSQSEYDRSNSRSVPSSCDDWLNYPNFTNQKTQVSCSNWGCNARGFLVWWLSHIPGNWWLYIIDWETAIASPIPTPTSTPTLTPTPTPTNSPTPIPKTPPTIPASKPIPTKKPQSSPSPIASPTKQIIIPPKYSDNPFLTGVRRLITPSTPKETPQGKLQQLFSSVKKLIEAILSFISPG